MSRFARERRVYFVEEPILDSTEPVLTTAVCPQTGVHVVTPHLPVDGDKNRTLEGLLAAFVVTHKIHDPILWFYTPMALEFVPSSITPSAVVYDCMDELSMFHGAPPRLRGLEEHLLQTADLVFTGGVSLFEAKRHLHPNVHPFPSGVDVHHFVQARNLEGGFREQEGLPHPRLGYAGVIDERINLPLVDEVARMRPEWQIIMIGPIAKISPDSLPRRNNIHWLGIKDYADLPKYFAGWNVGIMPFALNDATRFISPTKTPEYLSAGLPVVSTAIRDVVRPYGELGLARIADTAEEFVAAAEQAMASDMGFKWRERADEFLKSQSWESVWTNMSHLIAQALDSKQKKPVSSAPSVVSPKRQVQKVAAGETARV